MESFDCLQYCVHILLQTVLVTEVGISLLIIVG